VEQLLWKLRAILSWSKAAPLHVPRILQKILSIYNNFQASNFFEKLPEDNHLKKTEYIKIVPKTLFEDKISFELGSLSSPFVYQLSDAMMEVTLKITKSDGRTMPEPSVEVGPVNNVLSSLFESMQMQINDRQITESGRDYPYRCYLNTLLYLYQSHKTNKNL